MFKKFIKWLKSTPLDPTVQISSKVIFEPSKSFLEKRAKAIEECERRDRLAGGLSST